MNDFINNSFEKLRLYCEKEQYKGWDPYDGLNSKLFNSIPYLKKSAFARLCLIQGCKRSPINFRPILGIPKEYNAKGIGLFLNGYCTLYKVLMNQKEKEEADKCINVIYFLSELLIKLQNKNYSGACWGYNFDWQARFLFLFPKYTPTVVATTFCASALMEAYEITKEKRFLDVALSSADFVLKDLHREQQKEGFFFSYSPLDGNNSVYNASLLGSKLLSLCYKFTQKQEYAKVAKDSIIACVNKQDKDGSWAYGELSIQQWKDSFHTGYNLDALITYEENTQDDSFHENIEKGFLFYIQNFFEKDGTPKYYHNKMFPIDIHCPAQLFVVLHKMKNYEEYSEIAEKVLLWTIKNMQNREGFFYYQLKRGISSKISYMRWSNAFMFNAFTYYLLNKEKNVKE